jgi:hypothetical protein
LKVLRGANKEPYALKSVLGWTIHGPLARVSSNMASFHYIQTSTQHPNDALDKDIQRMFRMDFTDHNIRSSDLSIEDKYAVKIIKESTVHLPDGHYQVALPFKPNGDKVLDSHAAELSSQFRLIEVAEEKIPERPRIIQEVHSQDLKIAG